MTAQNALALLRQARPDHLAKSVNLLRAVGLVRSAPRYYELHESHKVHDEVRRLNDGWVARVGAVGSIGAHRPFVTRANSPTWDGQGSILLAEGVIDEKRLHSMHIHFDGERWVVTELIEDPTGCDHLVRVQSVQSNEPDTKHHTYRVYYALQGTPGVPEAAPSWQAVASRYVGTNLADALQDGDDGVGRDQETEEQEDDE